MEKNKGLCIYGLTEDFNEVKTNKYPEHTIFIGMDTGFFSVYYKEKWYPDEIIIE